MTNYIYCDSNYDVVEFSHDFTSFHANGSDDNIYIILLYFILYSFYLSTELLDYFLNIIILSNSHSFIQDACSYRSVIFNYEMSRLRSTVGKVNRSLDKLEMPPSVSVCRLSYASPFLIERYSSFFYPLLILTMDTTLFCFAKQWPMTRASSIVNSSSSWNLFFK